MEKILKNRGWVVLFLRRKLLSHSTEKFWVNTFVFQKSCCMEKKYEKEGSITTFCRQFSVSHTEKLKGELFYVSDNFLYGKNFEKPVFFHIFLSQFFHLKVPKDS